MGWEVMLTEHGYNGKFFVWTRGGHRPRHAHDTYTSAVSEAQRLAQVNPGKKFIVQQFLDTFRVEENSPILGEQEGACMNKQIWYGAKDNEVRFAEDKSILTTAGINDAQSFTVNGDVTGLNLLTAEQVPHGQSSSQAQA